MLSFSLDSYLTCITFLNMASGMSSACDVEKSVSSSELKASTQVLTSKSSQITQNHPSGHTLALS